MNAGMFIALSLAGGLGAVSRLVLDGAVKSRFNAILPIGTNLINLSGSLALGLIAGFVASGMLPEGWEIVAGTGFLGGYTTFSTASFETVRLAQEGRGTTSLVNGIGGLIGCTALAALGLWIGSR